MSQIFTCKPQSDERHGKSLAKSTLGILCYLSMEITYCLLEQNSFPRCGYYKVYPENRTQKNSLTLSMASLLAGC